MEVILNFNNKNYTLKLHEMDIWTHSASISEQEMVTFIKDIFDNNSNVKIAVVGGVSNVKK